MYEKVLSPKSCRVSLVFTGLQRALNIYIYLHILDIKNILTLMNKKKRLSTGLKSIFLVEAVESRD